MSLRKLVFESVSFPYERSITCRVPAIANYMSPRVDRRALKKQDTEIEHYRHNLSTALQVIGHRRGDRGQEWMPDIVYGQFITGGPSDIKCTITASSQLIADEVAKELLKFLGSRWS